jgi:hypothetical protein
MMLLPRELDITAAGREARLLVQRQLVRQLGPLAFDHGTHFIRDMVDVLDIEHVLVEAPYTNPQWF